MALLCRGITQIVCPRKPDLTNVEAFEAFDEFSKSRHVILVGMCSDNNVEFLVRHLLDVFKRLVDQAVAIHLDVPFIVNAAIYQDMVYTFQCDKEAVSKSHPIHADSNRRRTTLLPGFSRRRAFSLGRHSKPPVNRGEVDRSIFIRLIRTQRCARPELSAKRSL